MESPSILVTLLAFLLALGPLIVIHEFGHYLVGRWFGVKADVFSVGFGRELAGFTDRRGTRWKLSALPLGGYVQFAGDTNPASLPTARDVVEGDGWEKSEDFHSKPLWQRALIVAAGPATNFLFAIAIFAGFFMAFGKDVTAPVIDNFAEQSTAQAAGLEVGDRIIAVNGGDISSFIELARQVELFPGKTVRLTVMRDGSDYDFIVPIADVVEKDRFGNEAHVGRIGVMANRMERLSVGPIEALGLASQHCLNIVKMMVTGLGQIITGDRSVDELGGPIKIAKYSGEQFSLGGLAFIQFLAMISINLGFINLLPIPALDGGHLAFYAAEAVRRKPLGPRGQEWAVRTGIALVLALMVFVTFNDVVSLISPGS